MASPASARRTRVAGCPRTRARRHVEPDRPWQRRVVVRASARLAPSRGVSFSSPEKLPGLLL